MNNPLVSIIIPTMNSQATISQCIQSIKNQSYPDIEIIVVDNFSTDDTREIAEKFGAKVIQSRVAVSQARNIGIEKSAGGLIFSVDSDMELTATVVQECINKINEGYDAVIIPEVSFGIGFWAKCKALEKSCYIGDDVIEAPRFFRKAVVESLSGYDAELEAGEDWDMNQRVRKTGYRIARVPAHVKHDEQKLSLRGTMKKKNHYGRTIKKYERKHPLKSRQQLRLIRPAFIRNWKKLVREPSHAVGLFVLKGCEFVALKLGTLSGINVRGYKSLGEHTTRRVTNLTRTLSGKLNLDAGCGQGNYARYFRGQVVGLDLDRRVLRMSKKRYAEVMRGSIAFLPFRPQSFDYVLSSEVLEHLHESEGIRALKELETISNRIVLTTPNRNILFSVLNRIVYGPENPQHVSRWSTRLLRERQFDVHGCLGWVSAERIPKIFHRLWDSLSWDFPGLLGGDLIAIKDGPKMQSEAS
jgi:glycosyltransferase involved in cell wall biosynthesis/SAM-dependent methyltransferase